jgi:hypothetical protein
MSVIINDVMCFKNITNVRIFKYCMDISPKTAEFGAPIDGSSPCL